MPTSLQRLNRLLTGRNRWQLLGLFWCSLLTALFELVGVGSIMPFVATASQPTSVTTVPALAFFYHLLDFQTPRGFLLFWGFVVLVALGIVNCLTALTIWLGSRFGNEMQLQLARRLYHGYLVKPYQWHLSRHSATLAESLMRCRQLAETVYKPLATLLARGLTATALVITLVWLDPLVALTTTGVLFVVFSGVYFQCRSRLRKICQAESQAGFRLATTVADSFGALKQVQMTGTEGYFVQVYTDQIHCLGEFMMQRTWISEIPRIALHGLTNMSILLLVVYLEATLKNAQMLIPMVSLYALAGYRIIPGLQLCLSCFLILESSGPVLQSLWEDLEDMPGASTSQDVPAPLRLRHHIAMRSISYQYPESTPAVLRDCSLEIPVGSKVGIVGPSGLGKTTLVNLLAGLLHPQQGQLEMDGQPIGADMLRSWRRSIGYVPQDVFLMADTIGANIALGTPGAEIDLTRLENAAQKAALHSFITSLPEGYQTQVGERGIRLSGGQRQRIGLARALYHEPQLLLLDEATSALDSGTEAGLMKTLQSLTGTVTMVLVAHRLSTVQDCEQIYVMGEGGIVAQGTYADLLRDSPEFQAIAPAEVA